MVNAATTMDTLTVEGCALRILVAGEADRPALVLSHMLGTDLTLWDGIAPELARQFRLVRLDARGHGGSELGDAPVTLERLGRDIVAALDALGIERAHFCGISMGGAVGLWLLANAPARIERAVIADSAAKLGTPAQWNARIAAALADGIDPEATIERWFSPGFAERAPEKVEAVRAMLRATPREGYVACSGALRDMDLREAVRAIAHPVLVVRGRDDPSVLAMDAAQLVEAIDGAALVEFDARHCPLVEVEAEFVAALVKFLTAAGAPRRASGSRARAGDTKASARSKSSPQAKSAARRAGGRAVVAARRPVARTVPVSGKAAAKASATRKAAARAAPRPADPAPSRRPTAAKPARVAARATEKTDVPKTARPAGAAKAATAGRAKSAHAKSAPAEAAPAKAAPAKAAGKVAPVAATKRGKAASAPTKPVNRRAVAITTSAKTRPTTAAALRAAAAGKAVGPGKLAKSSAKEAIKKPTAAAPAKTRPASAKIKPAPAKTRPAPAKASAGHRDAPRPSEAKPTRGGPARRGKL